jgi:prophage maintenance system killer protein
VDEAETMVVAAAAGELDTAAIATWLRDHGQSSSTT